MKKDATFPVEVIVDDRTCRFNVREHSMTDGRFTVEYISENESLSFQLVRTPVGHWVAGNAKIPNWICEHANELGKIISSTNNQPSLE